MQRIFSSIKKTILQFDWSLKNILFHCKKNKNIVFFLCGFLFDVITIKRIDAVTDILLQIGYLMALSFLLVHQYRANKGDWKPGRFFGRIWPYNVEILHFLYGGLLSAYVILYLKSTSGGRALFFLLFMVALLIVNEMPQVRRFGYRLRLGLYAFCVTSFLIYFVSIVVGRMGTWVFALSIFFSVLIVWGMAHLLAKNDENVKKTRMRLFLPAGVLFIIVVSLYFLRLIPPVPLSIPYQGIFHQVLRDGPHFQLRYPKPPFYAFWRDDSQPFLSRPKDEIQYFARVFAPRRFKTQVKVRWERYDDKKEKYITTDTIPMDITGGRGDGFRGSVSKSNYTPGEWRVSTETLDGRTVGYIQFEVKQDESNKKRVWIDHRM